MVVAPDYSMNLSGRSISVPADWKPQSSKLRLFCNLQPYSRRHRRDCRQYQDHLNQEETRQLHWQSFQLRT